jgi:hypothetical protein
MKTAVFKSGIEKALTGVGFQRTGNTLQRECHNVATLIGLQKGDGNQWFMNVGFWLSGMGGTIPDRVEQTHLYFRLERLFPRYRETILTAGALSDEEQPAAYRQLIELLDSQIAPELQVLATEASLRKGLGEGRLTHGLVRKEVRDYLSVH